MNRLLHIALCLALCSCVGGMKKKKSTPASEQTLGQRLNRPDTNRRSHFEKQLSRAADGRGSAGARFQKQAFQASNFSGTSKAGGIDGQFKTKQSMWSRMKFWGRDSSFAGADKASAAAAKTFDTGDAFNTAPAREGAMKFSGADDVFGTDNALSRSDRIGRTPKIIDTIDTTSTSGKYTEDEVKSILNRN